MIIKSVHIENFLCYYENNTFHLSDGLNIILGENGEGKTKFFEAIEWLFYQEDLDLINIVSEKKKKELILGESCHVKVKMIFKQYNSTYTISKYFQLLKEQDGFITSEISFEGIEENFKGERNRIDGKSKLDSIFPPEIRKYSMFKGETELKIIDKPETLKILIDNFSDAKYYRNLSDFSAVALKSAENAVSISSKKTKKNKEEYDNLEKKIMDCNREIDKYEKLLLYSETEVEENKRLINDIKKHVKNSKELNKIDKCISELQEDRSRKVRAINEDYTQYLFDEKWILFHFKAVLDEFSEKINQLSKERRQLQSEFDKEIGKKEAANELINGSIPFPLNVPSKDLAEEMLNDQICKACNRELLKGSEAYKYVENRIKEYVESLKIQKDNINITKLYQYNFTRELDNISNNHQDNIVEIKGIKTQIKETFEFNNSRKTEVQSIDAKIDKLASERNNLVGSSSISESTLSNTFFIYQEYQDQIVENIEQSSDLKNKLKQLNDERITAINRKNDIDIISAESHLIKTKTIIEDINKIFTETKANKYAEFINDLEQKSNSFFKEINVDAFTGEIKFNQSKKTDTDDEKKNTKDRIEISLQEGGKKFEKPNQSLLTSMHISILFAISQLAAEVKNESFPMIFDAPTSSFGEIKTSHFLRLISSTNNQKILLLKDFIGKNDDDNTLFIKDEFNKIQNKRGFWVKLKRPFNQNDLSTIQSEVITL